MPSPPSALKFALSALLLGLTFMAANLYLGDSGHPKLATLFFLLATVSILAFAVGGVVWVYSRAWHREPERAPGPMRIPPGMKPPAMKPPAQQGAVPPPPTPRKRL